ncbi:Spherulation-specific family 4, partial [Coniella lustricola]
TNILLPLYVYPVAGAWDPVYAAIAANPTLQFQVVINPSSGPGVPAAQNGSDAIGYDDNWINATATVNSFANARTFGYVHLLNGQSPLDQVQANLSTWRAWGNASNIAGQRNASIHGVFFDETPDNMTAYMANVTQLAHATLDNDDDNTTSTINTIFNVGKAALDNAYFALADHVIVCEIAAENYSTSVPTANVPAEFASRAAILVYD